MLIECGVYGCYGLYQAANDMVACPSCGFSCDDVDFYGTNDPDTLAKDKSEMRVFKQAFNNDMSRLFRDKNGD